MTLQGKGFFICNLNECEGGDPASILATAQATGLSHVIVKIADGEQPFGLDASGTDLTALIVQALHAAGIAVWGWHSVHGISPVEEAVVAVNRTQALGLDGYVLEAWDGYGQSGMGDAASQFISMVRSSLAIPIALSSYRFPNYHPEMPWSTFLEFCDLHMPQVTWEQAHDAGAQLRESKRQCDALPNARPFIPMGAAYCAPSWVPSVAEIDDFLGTARALGIPAVNFYHWEACRRDLPFLWTAIADFPWPIPAFIPAEPISPLTPMDEFLAGFLTALNSRQSAQAGALYDQDAIQVRADQILPGSAAIQTGYAAFFESLPVGAIFSISWTQAEGDMRLFSWKAGTLTGETTLVFRDGKILLDYTFIC